MNVISKYTYGRDKLYEKDLNEILSIWKNNPYAKITYLGKIKKEFEDWAIQQGATKDKEGFYCIKNEESES